MHVDIQTKIDHKTIAYNGNTIHYYVSGKEDGECVVLLHAAFGDHRCFDKQIDNFSPHFRLIAIDMLGHGRTGVGNSKDNVTATTTQIAEILKAENREKTHLIGASFGSLIAQDFALKHPEKVLSLTAVGGYDINTEQREIAKSQAKEVFRMFFKILFSMNAFRRYVSYSAVINEVERARYFESAKHFTRKSFKVMSGFSKLIANRQVERSYPLLILVGDHDNALSLKYNRKWHEQEPTNSRFVIIEQAGHCANMDNADAFNAIVMDFLRMKEEVGAIGIDGTVG